jgi:hypothetical protein
MGSLRFIAPILIIIASSTAVAITGSDRTAPVLQLPGPIQAEADSAEGAVVVFQVSATDDRDLAPKIWCSYTSGDVFAVGRTWVWCRAKDLAGNKDTGKIRIDVSDSVAPRLSLPANIIADASSTSGKQISYSASATDRVDGSVAVICSPRSSSMFPLGDTEVSCSSSDSTGNSASGRFKVTVNALDNVPPILTLPSTIRREALSAQGTKVDFSVDAIDQIDGPSAVICAPASGAVFPIGDNTVSCSSSDSVGNTSRGSFVVAVGDSSDPILTLPEDITLETQSAGGAVVDYQVSATDAVDSSVAIACAPQSGSTFAPGESTVRCEAMDWAGNVSRASFLVSVVLAAADSYSANLSWVVPSSRENGDPLAITELAGYEVYVIAEASGEDQLLAIDDPMVSKLVVPNLAPDTYFFSISSIDKDGLISRLSSIISLIVPG